MQAWRFLIALALGAGLAACATDPEEGDEDWEDCGGKCDDASSGVAPLNAPDLLVNDLAVLGQVP